MYDRLLGLVYISGFPPEVNTAEEYEEYSFIKYQKKLYGIERVQFRSNVPFNKVEEVPERDKSVFPSNVP